jgi:hypothetical protein
MAAARADIVRLADGLTAVTATEGTGRQPHLTRLGSETSAEPATDDPCRRRVSVGDEDLQVVPTSRDGAGRIAESVVHDPAGDAGLLE